MNLKFKTYILITPNSIYNIAVPYMTLKSLMNAKQVESITLNLMKCYFWLYASAVLISSTLDPTVTGPGCDIDISVYMNSLSNDIACSVVYVTRFSNIFF